LNFTQFSAANSQKQFLKRNKVIIKILKDVIKWYLRWLWFFYYMTNIVNNMIMICLLCVKRCNYLYFCPTVT
jgi:hypothetical protein